MVGFGGVHVGNDDDEMNEAQSRRWKGRKGVKGPPWAKMPLLTIGLLGAQIVWSTEMGYASPYLISLGLSKSLMSMVFVAGPLSGLLVQPLIGVLADNSTSRFGRRRPYIFYGSVLCVVAMLLLGFTKDVASWFLDRESSANATLTIWLAVLAIYCIDFSINAVQAADRALLVDTLPSSQQERGNAWAGRMLSIGSVVGFWVGNLSLPSIFPIFGRTQLQVLCVLTSMLLLASHGVTILSVKERVLLPESEQAPQQSEAENGRSSGWRHYPAKTPPKRFGPVAAIKDIWVNVQHLPTNIRQICLIQFFSWIGWFPVLFFSTVWVGEIYTLAVENGDIKSPLKDVEDLEGLSKSEEATIVGATALLYSSLLGLITIFVLPLVVAFFKKRQQRRQSLGFGRHGGFHIGLAEIWMFSLLLFAGCMFATFFTSSSVYGSILTVALTGFCFAVSQWVPFSLLAEEILAEGGSSQRAQYEAIPEQEEEMTQDQESIPLHQQQQQRLLDDPPQTAGLVFDAGDGMDAHQDRERNRSRNGAQDPDERTLVDNDDRPSAGVQREDERALMKDLERSEYGVESPFVGGSRREDADGNEEPAFSRSEGSGKKVNIAEKAGIILGIHNVAIVVPQFLVTGLSSIIFALFESGISGVHPGAGHAGAGVGTANDVVPDSSGAGPDPDIGFDEKGSGRLVRIAARALARSVGPKLIQGLHRRLEKGTENESVSNPDGIGLVFKIGGFSSLIACALCWKLAKDLRRRQGR
ncbi:MFS general substrate transporter [Serendipita vermifera]|nr:MFS general substrate transporter [Serendipita vermifera]